MVTGYTIVGSTLGRMLVAGSPRGIAFLCFGDTDAEVVAALEAEFPVTRLSPWDGLDNRAGAIAGALGQAQPEPLPLDVRGTAFQRRVWDALLHIPFGETRTYTEIAEGLGGRDLARAVGRACAANPVSVVIPCHRMLHRDGGLAGYRWGLARKRALLDLERGAVGAPIHA